MLCLWFVANTVLWPFKTDVGGLTLQLNVVVLIVAAAACLCYQRTISIAAIKIASCMAVYLAFSFAVARAGPCTDKFGKALVTAPILLALVLLGFELGRSTTASDWLKLQKAASWALLAAFAGFVVELFLPAWFPAQAGYRATGRLSGLFPEPSLVAFSLFPCIAVLLVAQEKSMRRRGLAALFALFVVSRSSTLIALTLAWFAYRIFTQRKLGRGLLIALALGLLIAIGSVVDYDLLIEPTVARIAGVNAGVDATNISSLVYVQGWQDAWANLLRTRGLGLGFNRMGCHPLPDVSARVALAFLWPGLDELNATDGSILFGKVVSEAGIFGIAFYVAVVWSWIVLEKARHRFTLGDNSVASQTQMALVFCFVATSFIRSSGYFNGSVLLWVLALSTAVRDRIHRAEPNFSPASNPSPRPALAPLNRRENESV